MEKSCNFIFLKMQKPGSNVCFGSSNSLVAFSATMMFFQLLARNKHIDSFQDV